MLPYLLCYLHTGSEREGTALKGSISATWQYQQRIFKSIPIGESIHFGYLALPTSYSSIRIFEKHHFGDFGKYHSQVNVTVAIANWEGISRKASARDNRKGLK
jgi:hypothetical protein